MRSIITIAACCGLSLVGTLACVSSGQQPAARPSRQVAPATHPAAPVEPVIERGTVRLIRLPEADAGLPRGAGRETVMTYCAMCHTPGYITLQPPLSRETWTAEVTKMQKAFSGPIPQEKVGEIVEYCVAVRGAK
jgi:mono/diheme cytochrome c family protein